MCDEGNGGVKKGWRRCMMNESLCLYLTLINCIDSLCHGSIVCLDGMGSIEKWHNTFSRQSECIASSHNNANS